MKRLRLLDPTSNAEVGRYEVVYVTRTGRECRRDLAAAMSVDFATDVVPVREFPSYRGQRNFPGYYWSRTTGTHIPFESRFEARVLTVLDRDPTVVGMAAQPFWIFGADLDGTWKHAPDFFVRRADGSAEVINVRPVDRRTDERFVRTCVNASVAFGSVGWRYRVEPDPEPTDVEWANLDWISAYRRPYLDPFNLSTAVLDAASEDITIGGLADRVAHSSLDRMIVLPVIFSLIWDGRLACDLATPLRGSTLVRTARVGS